MKRPLAMVLSIVVIVLVLAVAIGMVLPQMASTASEIGKKIPAFMEQMMEEFERLAADEPVLADWVNELESMEINWDNILESIIHFLKNGAERTSVQSGMENCLCLFSKAYSGACAGDLQSFV